MADLVRTIRVAFEAVPYPTGASLCSGYDDEGINEFFGDRNWQDHVNSVEMRRAAKAGYGGCDELGTVIQCLRQTIAA